LISLNIVISYDYKKEIIAIWKTFYIIFLSEGNEKALKKRYYLYFLLLAVTLFFVVSWFITIIGGGLPLIDKWMQSFAAIYAETPIYTIFRWITELGSKHFVQPFTIVMTIIIWWIFRDWLPALTFGLGVLGSHLLNNFIKELVARERPSISVVLNAEGFSYPSGHAMVSIVCYGLLAFFIAKKLKSSTSILLVQFTTALIVFLIGLSRPFLNVHYLTDVATGFFLGFFFFIGLVYLYEFIQRKRKKVKA